MARAGDPLPMRLPQAESGVVFGYGPHGLCALLLEPTSLLNTTTAIVAVLIGGLGDGLLGFDYLPVLRDRLAEVGVPLVQPILRTSYRQYGFGTLAQDVEDLDDLIGTLETSLGRLPRVLLIGHSTGCQDAITFAKSGKRRAALAGLVLQSAVSDREFLQTLPQEVNRLAEAHAKRERGELDAFLSRTSDSDPPLTARRALAFQTRSRRTQGPARRPVARLGDDDLFSSDLSDAELQTLYAGVTVPTRWIFAQDDEYVTLAPEAYRAHAHRLCQQMPAPPPSSSLPQGVYHRALLLPGNHAFRDHRASQIALATEVAAFATALCATFAQ